MRVHHYGSDTSFEELKTRGGIEALRELKEKGLVKELSLGMSNPSHLLKVLEAFPATFDTVMMAGAWNLLDQSGLPVLMHCQTNRIPVQIGGAFGAGLLWGADRYNYYPATETMLQRRAQWAHLCAKHKLTLQSLALAFAASPAIVKQVAVGCANAAELDECVAAASQMPTLDQFLHAMEDAVQMGLIHAENCIVSVPPLMSEAPKVAALERKKEEPSSRQSQENSALAANAATDAMGSALSVHVVKPHL